MVASETVCCAVRGVGSINNAYTYKFIPIHLYDLQMTNDVVCVMVMDDSDASPGSEIDGSTKELNAYEARFESPRLTGIPHAMSNSK